MEFLPNQVDLSGNYTFEDFLSIVAESKQQRYWFNPDIAIPLILAYGLIIVFGCAANGLICFVVFRNKELRTIPNFYIVNLSVSDIVMCLFCMPFTLIKLLQKNWTLGDTMCRLVPWLQSITVFVSTLTITAIALDRYKVIVHVYFKKDSSRKWMTVMVIISIWFISVLAGLPLLVYSKVENKSYIRFARYDICLESWPSDGARIGYAVVATVLQFLIPIVILMTTHWRLCSFLKTRIAKDPTTATELRRSVKEANRHRKNSTVLMAIAISFALCWFPLSLLNLLADLKYSIFMFQNFLLAFGVTHILAMTSACLNPILYGWFNPNFRREVKSALFFWQNMGLRDEKASLFKSSEDQFHRTIIFKRSFSYKAVQTEVQPVLTPSSEIENLSSDP